VYNETTNLLLKKINVPEYIIRDISKNNNINFLRLLLAYMVVIFHSMSLSGNQYPLGKLFDGHIAVCGFFIISGFLIMRSYWSSNCLKDYLIKRCKRLLPAYCFVIIICMIGLSLISNLPAEEYFKSPQLIKYFVANIFFMNFLQPSLPGVFIGNPGNMAVDGSLWTIKIEIGFYLIVPIIAYILGKCKTKKRINILLACMYLFGYIYNFVCLYMAKKMENGFIQYFAVGIFCVINYDLIRKYDKFLIIPGIIILVLYYTIGNECLLPIGLGIIIMYIGFNFKRLNNIGKNGDYSYGAYIYHYPLIQILIALGYFKLNKYITLLIVMGTVFSMAYISWNFLERKFLKR
jgi:peptidoglycan/LPS O-acetylase OafA/YrhL